MTRVALPARRARHLAASLRHLRRFLSDYENRSGGGPQSLSLTAATTGRSAWPLRSCKLLSGAAPLRRATFPRSAFPNTRLAVTRLAVTLGPPASFAAGGPAVHQAKASDPQKQRPAARKFDGHPFGLRLQKPRRRINPKTVNLTDEN